MSDQIAECPKRATLCIVAPVVLEPAPVVGHEVAEPASLIIEGMAQKTQVHGGKVAQRGIQRLEALCHDGDNQRTGIVVHAIAVRPVWNRVPGVLKNARSIGHPAHMVQLDLW